MAGKGWMGLFGLAAALVATAAVPHEQPLPFSHKSHAGDLKQECKLCHTNPDPGKTEGIVAAAACMQCHAAAKSPSPAIRKLAAYARNNRPIPWVRLYTIPDFVIFSHRAHVSAGNTCESCHGNVTRSEELSVAPDFTQAHCLACHKASNVSTDCGFCHDLK